MIIKSFNNYEVTICGKIINRNTNRIIKTKPSGGYERLKLSNGGRCKKIYLHRLLAEAFIPNPENKPQVNHKDGDKLNNYIANLEWVTPSENGIHSYRVLGNKVGFQSGHKVKGGIHMQFKKGQLPHNKKRVNVTYGLRPGIYNSLTEASSANKIDFRNLSAIIKGRQLSKKIKAVYI